jgi:hypothetical protein
MMWRHCNSAIALQLPRKHTFVTGSEILELIMGKTKGAKDKKPSIRRNSTEAEKAAWLAKKARKEQYQVERERAIGEQRRANFFSQRRASKTGNSSESKSDEAEVQYVEIPMNECNGTANLGSFVATIDDDSEEQDADETVEGGTQDGEESLGVMKSFMKAVMLRIKLPLRWTTV